MSEVTRGGGWSEPCGVVSLYKAWSITELLPNVASQRTTPRRRGTPQNAPRLARGLVLNPREPRHTNKHTGRVHADGRCDLLARPAVR